MAAIAGLKSKDLLEAQSHVWNDLFSFIKSMSLKCCVQLGIADAIHSHGKPITLDELAAALSIPSCRVPGFQRLMTFLVHNGYFVQTKDGGAYALTPNSAFLVKGNDALIAPFIEMVLDQDVFDPWHVVGDWFRCEEPSTPFEKFHGKYLWVMTAEDKEMGDKFRVALGSDAAAVAKVIVEDFGDVFRGARSVVEVAGATGQIALAVAKAFPEIKCSVMDLPLMIEAVEKSDSIGYVAGDMFEGIPPADVLILKWVMMTWNDEECVKILKRCKEATPSKENGGKVILIEKVLDTTIGVPKHVDTQLFYDLQMMVYTNGRQRSEGDWKKLFSEAGLHVSVIIIYCSVLLHFVFRFNVLKL